MGILHAIKMKFLGGGADKIEGYVRRAQEMSKRTGRPYKECLEELIKTDKEKLKNEK
jgi:hypothetical protein